MASVAAAERDADGGGAMGRSSHWPGVMVKATRRPHPFVARAAWSSGKHACRSSPWPQPPFAPGHCTVPPLAAIWHQLDESVTSGRRLANALHSPCLPADIERLLRPGAHRSPAWTISRITCRLSDRASRAYRSATAARSVRTAAHSAEALHSVCSPRQLGITSRLS